MFSLQIILSLFSIIAVCFAGCLLHALRVTRQQISQLQDEAANADIKIQALEMQAWASTEIRRSTASQIDALLIRQARIEKSSDRRTYDEAINLSRRGADARELENSCGLSLGEARLIKTLYGGNGNNDSLA